VTTSGVGQGAALSLLERFERAWQAGTPPDLTDFLPAPHDPGRPVAVAALAHADYLGRFAELATDRDAALALIAWEYELRLRRESGLGLEEYLKRFPEYAGDLTERLSRLQAAGAIPTVPGYEILAELGRGGMGVVYRVRQTALNRLAALKVVRWGAHASEAELGRFRREAEAVARLSHPNIVQVYEVGEHDGLPFFSLEFCGGGTLRERLNGKPLAPREAAALVRVLAEAVHLAHQRGVLHRDLKPANVSAASAGAPPGSGPARSSRA
jgi:hypothetical protein